MPLDLDRYQIVLPPSAWPKAVGALAAIIGTLMVVIALLALVVLLAQRSAPGPLPAPEEVEFMGALDPWR
jgi:hypothetical protein